MAGYKYVLIGNSAAAISAAEAIRKKDKDSSLAIVSAEDSAPYSPALTTYYISGTITKENIYYRSKSFYKKNKIDAYLGNAATGLDSKKKEVTLKDGTTLRYEKLLISTGGSPKKPDLKGVNLDGVFTLRTLDDAEKIKAKAKTAKKAIILGGGLVGLRAAYALHQIGIEVYILVGSGQILSQNLDKDAADIMQSWLKEKNFNILTQTKVEAIEGKDKVQGVRLSTSEIIEADIVIIGKGVKPNTELAEQAQAKIDRGIVVDDYMKTSVKDIYAAGDVAQAYDMLTGKKAVNAIWPAATEQGRIAGTNMAGTKEKYEGSIAMNSVDFYGLSALSIGISRPRNEDDYEIVVIEDSKKRIYRKLVLKNDVIVGAILVGDIDRAGIITGLIKDKVIISDFKDALINNRFGFMILPKTLRDKKIKAEA